MIYYQGDRRQFFVLCGIITLILLVSVFRSNDNEVLIEEEPRLRHVGDLNFVTLFASKDPSMLFFYIIILYFIQSFNCQVINNNLFFLFYLFNSNSLSLY